MPSKLAAVTAILAVVLVSYRAAAQQNSGATSKSPSQPRHVFTNEDFESRSSASGDGLPSIPGLIKCGSDLKCFVEALDKARPAAVTRTEIVNQGIAAVTSNSTWWTTQFAAGKCTVSLRVDALAATANDKVENPPAARNGAEAKLAEMIRDFESIRGKTGTCSLPVRDLRSLMTSPSWSLMSLGPVSNFGKNCSGGMFDGSHGALSSEKQ